MQSEVKEVSKVNKGIYRKFFKRPMDFLLSLIAIIMLSPALIVVAILVRFKLGSPVLFKQKRPGLNEKIFTMYKFRTMTDEKDENGELLPDSVRLNKFGRMLRSTSLDELPELFNILKGNMSFVGPRPERECFYEEFETYIHGFKNRLAVTPGLTGMAQVNGGYDLGPEEKIVYDMEYIKKQSLWLDIKLVFKTVKLVFTHEGAR